MSKAWKVKTFKKIVRHLLILMIILPICVPAMALPPPDIQELADEVTMVGAPLVLAPALYEVTKAVQIRNAMENVGATTEDIVEATRFARFGVTTIAYLLAEAPVTAFDLAAKTYNEQIQTYFEALWGDFLNDTLYMGPSPSNSKVTYVRDVFDDATALVNQTLTKANLVCCLNPDHIFLSENFFPDHKVINKKAYFYVPATDFFTGKKSEKIQKVAVDIMSQIAWMFYKSEVTDVMDSHHKDGSVRHWYSATDPMPFNKAAKLWASTKLGVPPPNLTKDEFASFVDDYEKYREESKSRSDLRDNSNSKEEYHFRKHRFTTSAGPETGEELLSPCSFDGLELLLGRQIPKCHTINIAGLNNPKLQGILRAARNAESDAIVHRNKRMTEIMAGIIASMIVQYVVGRAIGNALKVAQEAKFVAPILEKSKTVSQFIVDNAKFAVDKTTNFLKLNGYRGVYYIMAPGVGFVVGDKSAHLVIRGKYDDDPITSGDFAPSDLYRAYNYLINAAINVKPDGSNSENALEMRQALNEAFKTDDPRAVEVFTKLTK
jgi:hypothetical protein